MKISVIITNWNGAKLLRNNLESVILNTPQANEFILIDDASQDDSSSYVTSLQKKYPKLKLIVNQKNLAFPQTSNKAVKSALGDLVVLLNNDIKPPPNYLNASLPHFKDSRLFGVGFAEIENINYPRLLWQEGYVQHFPVNNPKSFHRTAWLSGGSSIVSRKHFLKLGGFDPIYSPFYCEDLDLGYRAWKSGYSLLFEPKSPVSHRHSSTISNFPRYLVNFIKERNRLLVVWRNITDRRLLRLNSLALVGRCLFGPNYIKIIKAAREQIKKYPPPVVFPKLSDQQIFQLLA